MNNEEYDNSKETLNNFNNFFSNLSEAFQPKDAYEIYREKALSSQDGEEAIELMKKSIAEGRKYISDTMLEVNIGKLWAVNNARYFMKSKRDLARIYKEEGYTDLAIIEYEDLLKLDSEDNLNIKYELVPIFFSEKKYQELYDLTEKYSVEKSLFMLYLRSLYYFSKGDNINCKIFIKQALEASLYVAQYMLFIREYKGLENISKEEFIAMKFAEQMMRSWGQSELAMQWLMNEYFAYCSKHELDSLMSKEMVKKKLIKFFNN